MKESSQNFCSQCSHYLDCTTLPSSQLEVMTHLAIRVQELERENASLKNTVEWMHATIWDMVKKQRHSN
ncbi:MAG: hypothetical protein ACOX8K_11620 [Lachnospiraceae bacterium]